MAYIKNEWKDQKVERPKTYRTTKNDDGSITLIESFGLVEELGSPVNAARMQNIEDGIANCAIRKYSSNEIFALKEWVLDSTGEKAAIYESQTNNNQNNPLTDTEHWKKVLFDTAWGHITGNIADQSDLKQALPGEWTYKEISVFTSTKKGNYTINLSEYLPEDNCQYELFLQIILLATKAGCGMSLYSSVIQGIPRPEFNVGQTQVANLANTTITPFAIGADRILHVKLDNDFTITGINSHAYRRLGKIQQN